MIFRQILLTSSIRNVIFMSVLKRVNTSQRVKLNVKGFMIPFPRLPPALGKEKLSSPSTVVQPLHSEHLSAEEVFAKHNRK